MKVLVVEDDTSLATIIRFALEESGYEVRTARDANEGYCKFLMLEPEVVVTDICMPCKDGLEMIAEIRAHQPHVKTVYVTAQADQYRLRLEKEQADYPVTVLEKPFSSAELARQIAALTQHTPKPLLRKRALLSQRT
jgi:two-component system alkaline phosphatase synthesis response regulator PhoP